MLNFPMTFWKTLVLTTVRVLSLKLYAMSHAPNISFFESVSIFMKFYEMYDLFEFVLHLYEHLCFIYGKIIFQCSFRNGKSTTVLPYKNRIKPKSLVQMKIS